MEWEEEPDVQLIKIDPVILVTGKYIYKAHGKTYDITLVTPIDAFDTQCCHIRFVCVMIS
jgi:hypothetical protein